jgi:hypothetical protein
MHLHHKTAQHRYAAYRQLVSHVASSFKAEVHGPFEKVKERSHGLALLQASMHLQHKTAQRQDMQRSGNW